jgi:beta-lactamase superfamily II metal-dependent hydrolase
VGFSIKTAILVLIFGGVIAGGFALHRLQPQAKRTCRYTNWASPCHTSGWHVDYTDVSAGVVVLIASLGSGLIVGTRSKKKQQRKMSAAAQRA